MLSPRGPTRGNLKSWRAKHVGIRAREVSLPRKFGRSVEPHEQIEQHVFLTEKQQAGSAKEPLACVHVSRLEWRGRKGGGRRGAWEARGLCPECTSTHEVGSRHFASIHSSMPSLKRGRRRGRVIGASWPVRTCVAGLESFTLAHAMTRPDDPSTRVLPTTILVSLSHIFPLYYT